MLVKNNVKTANVVCARSRISGCRRRPIWVCDLKCGAQRSSVYCCIWRYANRNEYHRRKGPALARVFVNYEKQWIKKVRFACHSFISLHRFSLFCFFFVAGGSICHQCVRTAHQNDVRYRGIQWSNWEENYRQYDHFSIH